MENKWKILMISAMVLVVMALITGGSIDVYATKYSNSIEKIRSAFKKGEISEENSLLYQYYVVAEPEKLPERFKIDIDLASVTSEFSRSYHRESITIAPRCLTPVLNYIQRNANKLPSEANQRFERFSNSRPNFGNHEQILETTHFRIHFTTDQADINNDNHDDNVPADDNNQSSFSSTYVDADDNDGIPDYIEYVGEFFEQGWRTETGDSNFGFRTPSSDGGAGGNNLFDVYVLWDTTGSYGAKGAQDHPPWIKLNSSFDDWYGNSQNGDFIEDPDIPDSDEPWAGAIKVTAAHEFFHAVQDRYDSQEETWILEGTAAWMEDAVFDGVNDYISFAANNLYFFWGTEDETLTNMTYDPVLYWKFFSEQRGHDKDGNMAYYYPDKDELGVDYNGVDIIKKLWEECENSDGVQVVNNTIAGPGDDFEQSFNRWARANYAKDFGDPYANGLLDYLEDEVQGGYASVTPINSIKISGTEKPPSPQVQGENVSAWAINYIAVKPNDTADVLTVSFNGNMQLTDLSENADFSELSIQCANDKDDNGNLDESDWISYSFISPIRGKKDNNVKHTFASTGKYKCEEIMVSVTGKTEGDSYDLEVSSLEFDFITPTVTNPVSVGSKDSPRKFNLEIKYPSPGLSEQDFRVKVGSKKAEIATLTQRDRGYVLTIHPPKQKSNKLYDISLKLVNVANGTFTEENAVRYGAHVNVDVPLVLDRSGSMSGDKISEAKSAAKQFVSLMDDGDMIGVASFIENARVDYPLTEITSQSIKDDSQDAINGISASGRTSIGDGLSVGQDQLDSKGNSSHDHSIVLMSDGHENEPRYVSDVLPGIPDKTDVYTVAFGSSPDESLLKHIAEETGGKYYRTHVNRDISNIYNRIAAVATGQQTITSKSGSVNENETSTIDTVVDSTVTEASFVLGWSGSDLDLTLEDPSGNTIDLNSASSNPDISYSSGSTFETYIVKSPNSGDWKMQVEGVNTPSGGEPYSANVTADSNLTFDTYFDKSQYTEGQPITVLASLSEEAQPLTGAKVNVVVQPPAQSTSKWKEINGDTAPTKSREILEGNLTKANSSSTTTLTLYDDGNHGDGSADDGVYGNLYQQTSKSGSYIFKFDASGTTTQGDDFTRTAQRSMFVEQTSASGSVEGEISYAGKESGKVYIRAWENDSTLSGNPDYQTSISSPGSYQLGGLPDGIYYIQAFMDSDGNGVNDAEDPAGIYGDVSPEPVQISGGSAQTDIDVDLCGTIVSTILPKGYNLFSIPGRSHDFDPEEALGDEISSLYMYRWNPGKDEYDETSDVQLDLGFGSWLWVWDEDTQVELEVCVPPGESSTTLPDEGWHIVGAPFPIKWGEVKVNGTKIKNETSGSNYSGPLKPYIFPYDEADNEYDLAQPSSWNDLNLNRWDGYWIQTTQPDVKLSFDKGDSTSTSASASALRSRNQNILVTAKGKGISLPPAPPIQQLQGEGLQVVASPSLVKGSGEVTFTVWSEQPVEGLKVEVLAPNGQKVWNEKTSGSKLNWDTKGVPNGIYLYTASAKVDGKLQQAGIGKLLVLK